MTNLIWIYSMDAAYIYLLWNYWIESWRTTEIAAGLLERNWVFVTNWHFLILHTHFLILHTHFLILHTHFLILPRHFLILLTHFLILPRHFLILPHFCNSMSLTLDISNYEIRMQRYRFLENLSLWQRLNYFKWWNCKSILPLKDVPGAQIDQNLKRKLASHVFFSDTSIRCTLYYKERFYRQKSSKLVIIIYKFIKICCKAKNVVHVTYLHLSSIKTCKL